MSFKTLPLTQWSYLPFTVQDWQVKSFFRINFCSFLCTSFQFETTAYNIYTAIFYKLQSRHTSYNGILSWEDTAFSVQLYILDFQIHILFLLLFINLFYCVSLNTYYKLMKHVSYVILPLLCTLLFVPLCVKFLLAQFVILQALLILLQIWSPILGQLTTNFPSTLHF